MHLIDFLVCISGYFWQDSQYLVHHPNVTGKGSRFPLDVFQWNQAVQKVDLPHLVLEPIESLASLPLRGADFTSNGEAYISHLNERLISLREL